MSLDDRKSAILRAVVQQYIETAQPVGSGTVARRHDVAVSPATVRSEMHDLETEGYLVQPHTSAGRVPTEKGYRYFVDSIGGAGPLDPTNVAKVSEFFAAAHGELEQLLGQTSHLLSTLTDSAAVVTGTEAADATIRSVQLVDLSPTLFMAVAVTSAGSVMKHTFEVEGEAAAAELQDAGELLSATLVGSSLSAVGSLAVVSDRPGAALAARTLEAVARGVQAERDLLYVDGTSRIANVFDARETVESVLTVLEKQFVVVGLLKEIVDSGLTVAIGSETGVEPLAQCSVVVAPYRSDSGATGAIAVLGPTRMDYAGTVSAVAAVSERLSRLLTEGQER
ncbi:MAG: heat-inducible transcriptional repressor HrcA [Microthrixaceae bacterium]|nr:heat-inducible transcriptional repressor HrcA [Microthrixaceae bacterium]